MCPPLRPVAPLHSWRASRTTTRSGECGGEEAAAVAGVRVEADADTSSRDLAAAAAVMPLPMMTTSASRDSVSLCTSASAGYGGSTSQYGDVGCRTGRPGSEDARASSALYLPMRAATALATSEAARRPSPTSETTAPMVSVYGLG